MFNGCASFLPHHCSVRAERPTKTIQRNRPPGIPPMKQQQRLKTWTCFYISMVKTHQGVSSYLHNFHVFLQDLDVHDLCELCGPSPCRNAQQFTQCMPWVLPGKNPVTRKRIHMDLRAMKSGDETER